MMVILAQYAEQMSIAWWDGVQNVNFFFGASSRVYATQDVRIRQIQGVAYIHKWSHNTSGAFHMYPHGPGR